jgi:hypothetical protein
MIRGLVDPAQRFSMNDAPANVLNPETVLAEIKKHGVTHVVYLPDSETTWRKGRARVVA